MNPEGRFLELIVGYQLDRLDEAGFAELEAILGESESARAMFHRMCRMDSRLRQQAELGKLPAESERPEVVGFQSTVTTGGRSMLHWRWSVRGLAAAVVMMAGLLTWSHASRPRSIATLVSSEEAAWEGTLPTAPGSELSRGYLKLMAGLATIRFDSGAEMILEAPAKVALKGPLRAKLVSGAALIELPDQARNFVLETPHGLAVDGADRFAVHVQPDEQRSDFDVLAGGGGIEVEHFATGERRRLGERESVSLSVDGLTVSAATTEEIGGGDGSSATPLPLRIGTKGRATTVIRNNKPEKWNHPERLMLKQSNNGGGFDRRVVCAFDLSQVSAEFVESAQLLLNQVPSGIGYASRLPKVNRFAVYGLINPGKLDWQPGGTWEALPAPEDGVRLGGFEIPRSRQIGLCGIAGEELLQFVKQHAGQSVTLIVVRETAYIEGEGKGLVHAFASDLHPEAAGPVLELGFGDER